MLAKSPLSYFSSIFLEIGRHAVSRVSPQLASRTAVTNHFKRIAPLFGVNGRLFNSNNLAELCSSIW